MCWEVKSPSPALGPLFPEGAQNPSGGPVYTAPWGAIRVKKGTSISQLHVTGVSSVASLSQVFLPLLTSPIRPRTQDSAGGEAASGMAGFRNQGSRTCPPVLLLAQIGGRQEDLMSEH